MTFNLGDSKSETNRSGEGAVERYATLLEACGRKQDDQHRRPLALRFGLSLLAVTAFGQGLPKSVTLPRESLKLWVTSNIQQSCGNAIPLPVLRRDVEAGLNVAGVGVARVHTAELRIDLNCSPAFRSYRTKDMAVCLGLSEPRGKALATTWRKCESYTCRGQECEAVARSGLNSLVDWFIISREINSGYELPAQPATPGQQTTRMADEVDSRVIYFLTCILVSFAVLSGWQWCRRRSNSFPVALFGVIGRHRISRTGFAISR